jgi:methylmalonyl-CoA/ethylmalonyl-CoA epimerase
MAVKTIDETASVFVAGGYQKSRTVFDPAQSVNICWLTKEGMPTMELLEPIDEQSPVNNILKKNGVTLYHTCYMVDDLDQAVTELRKMKYGIVKSPVEAPAIGNCRVAFLFNRNIGLIELVESPANITFN